MYVFKLRCFHCLMLTEQLTVGSELHYRVNLSVAHIVNKCLSLMQVICKFIAIPTNPSTDHAQRQENATHTFVCIFIDFIIILLSKSWSLQLSLQSLNQNGADVGSSLCTSWLPFLGAVAKLRKVTVSFVMSFPPFAWNNSTPTGRMLTKLDI